MGPLRNNWISLRRGHGAVAHSGNSPAQAFSSVREPGRPLCFFSFGSGIFLATETPSNTLKIWPLPGINNQFGEQPIAKNLHIHGLWVDGETTKTIAPENDRKVTMDWDSRDFQETRIDLDCFPGARSFTRSK